MKYFYIFLSIITIMQVIKRRFDFISFGAITFIAYFINCAFGQTWITGGMSGYYYRSDISTTTYMLVFLQLFIINMYIIFEKNNIKIGVGNEHEIRNAEKKTSISTLTDYPSFWNTLLVFCYVSFIYNIVWKVGLNNFFSYTDKSLIGKNVSTLFNFAIWGCILCFLHAVKYKNRNRTYLSFFLILITVLIGSRAYIVTVVIGWIALKSGNIRNTVKENIRIFIFGAVLVLILLAYKDIYMAMRALDFSNVKIILSTGDFFTSLADIGEFRTVFSLYDYVVVNGLRLPLLDSFVRAISIIPFINNIIPLKYPIRLSTYLEEQMHSSYGLGGNFWGETIAMGGIVLLIIITIVWLVFLKKSSKHISGTSDGTVFIISAASYCSYYIHRLDWIQVMGCFKSIIVIYAVYMVWKKFSHKRVIRSKTKL